VSTSFLRRALVAVGAAVALVASTSTLAAAEPSATTRWYGDASSATGAALGQGVCDVDADGYDDLVVGAWFWDKAPTNNIGATYVLFGDAAVSGGDLQSPGDAGAARIDGPSVANAFTGFSVACLGDVNDDGFDDVGISHYTAEKVYVVLGAEEFGSLDLTNIGERGYEVQGDETNTLDYNVGFSMSPVGDYDDDGIDDYAIAGVVADTQGRTNNGRVWIVAGKEDVANVDLIDPAEGEVLATIDGALDDERLGSVSLAGDVDGDGIDDFVLGSYTSTPWGSGVAVPGQAYVVFGQSGAEIDLANLGDAGFAIRGPERGRDRLGISVSGAGDVDGDGLDDLLIGADGVYNAATGERPGTAWVVWGRSSTSTVYTNPAAGTTVYSCGTEPDPGTGICGSGSTQPRGYLIQGADTSSGTSSESTGYSVAGAGDVNGDEIPDFVIGAYGYDPVNPADPETTLTGAGAVFVVYGKTGTATQDLAALTEEQGYRIDGLANGDRFGRQVSAPGDLDGNGALDVVGAGDFAQRPLAPETPRSQAGEVVLALHGALATKTTVATSATGPVDAGEVFDLTATTNQLAAGGSAVTEGTVTFNVGGTPIDGCTDVVVDGADGTAECLGASLPSSGSHEITATFVGTGTFAASTSEPLVQDVTANAACAAERFADVTAANPFATDICWMATNGVSTGFPGEPLPTYQPSAAVSRQAMSAFMYRLAGSPDFAPGEDAPTFSDVSSSHPFATEIEWMAAEQISEGYEDGTYRPSLPVSRQAMSAFMYRLAGSPEFTPGEQAPTFSDVGDSHPFSSEIEWMAAEQISEGYEDGTYRPSLPVSRQAMSAFMHRLADGPGVDLGA
jgi:hypothetical protein